NYNAVPPPYTGNFMPSTPNLSFTGLDEFVNKPVVKNYKAKSSKEEPKNNMMSQKPRKPTRKDTQVPTESVTDEAVHKELGDRLTTLLVLVLAIFQPTDDQH
nr:hypothetical protein [Tanacetum cinerariifolium]